MLEKYTSWSIKLLKGIVLLKIWSLSMIEISYNSIDFVLNEFFYLCGK